MTGKTTGTADRKSLKEVIEKQEAETGGKLKAPTTEEASAIRVMEEEDWLNYGSPFEIGSKIVFIKELKIKDRLPLNRAYITILKKGIELASQIKKPEDFVAYIEKDLNTLGREDIDFIMAGLKPWNADIKESDLNELTGTEVRLLAKKIKEANKLEEALKKVNPQAERH
jgi:hypothetical protein